MPCPSDFSSLALAFLFGMSLQRSTGEFLRLRTVPCQPGQKLRSGRAGIPQDFSSAVGGAIQSFDIRYPVKAIAVVVLTTALLIGLGVLFPSRPVSFAALKAKLTKRDAVAVFPGRCWPERILGAVLSFGAF